MLKDPHANHVTTLEFYVKFSGRSGRGNLDKIDSKIMIVMTFTERHTFSFNFLENKIGNASVI